MKERGMARRVGYTGASFISRERAPAAAALCMGLSMNATAHGETKPAVVAGVAGGILLVTDFVDRIRREKNVFERGMKVGVQAGVQGAVERMAMTEMMPALEINILPDGVPYYASLDGETVAKNPEELLTAFGDPTHAATRVGLILHRFDQGEALTRQQAEYLRVVQATTTMLPGSRDILCERGTEMMDTVDGLVSGYEKEYRKTHPGASEEPQ